MKKLFLILFFIGFSSNVHAELSSQDWKKISQIISKIEQFGTLQNEQKKCISKQYIDSPKEIRSLVYKMVMLIQKDISDDDQEKLFIDELGLNWQDFENIVSPLFASCEVY